MNSLREQSKSTVNTTVSIPTFDPDSEDDEVNLWCEEIEKLGDMFKWSGYELLIRGASGLIGEAKDWFMKWKPVEKTWENFKSEICSLYPAKKNLSQKLRKVSLYTSDEAISYCEYARKKISLIKALNFDLSDDQLSELVIGDITDIHVKTAAFNSKVDSESEEISISMKITIIIPLGSIKTTNLDSQIANKEIFLISDIIIIVDAVA
ncbi:unnamed protein product [Phaedon cochleariae]|uniref:Retrotransposon gag domain-containing protein n=1 Tax=Phaedon cochleariae TaxID=80249 RepID=A0A9N9SDY8_PHACE|nr:unnamed protein product [Phaedon cochleariae]